MHSVLKRSSWDIFSCILVVNFDHFLLEIMEFSIKYKTFIVSEDSGFICMKLTTRLNLSNRNAFR